MLARHTVKGIVSLLTTDPRQTISDLSEAVEFIISEIKQGNLGPAFCAGFPNICELADQWDDLSFSDKCYHIGKVIPELAGTIFAAGKIVKGPAMVRKLVGAAKRGAAGAKDLGAAGLAAGRNLLKNGVAPRGGLKIKSAASRTARSVADKSWKDKIHGTAQKTGTPGHHFRTYREAIREAKKSDVTSVHLDHGYNRGLNLDPNTITPNRRPDVLSLCDDGSVLRIEVKSKTDIVKNLIDRNSVLDAQLRAQGFTPTPPRVVVPTTSP